MMNSFVPARLFRLNRSVVALMAAASFAMFSPLALAAEKPPATGEEAGDFELPALAGGKVKLSKLTADGPVVLVVMRGYPGYQCPICSRQYGEYLNKAESFKKAGAKVVFIYPGPADQLKERAGEFIKGRDYPNHFSFLIDPDYSFTNAYGLRWEAKNETAYPSTFVIDGSRKVTFATVSKTHGGRVKAEDALKAVAGK